MDDRGRPKAWLVHCVGAGIPGLTGDTFEPGSAWFLEGSAKPLRQKAMD